MPVDDKTLEETIGEVIGEAAGSNKDKTSVDTKKGISDGSSDDTKAGDTLEREYVSGIDISDIPEQDRPRIKELLSKKASLLEKGYQGKFSEVAQFKKAMENLTSRGLTVQEAEAVLEEHLKKKQSPQTINNMTENKKDASSLIDQLIEQSPENRASLEQLRTVILQVTNSSELKQKIDKIEQILGGMAGTVIETKKAKLSSEVDGLSEKYGKEFIDKVRDDLIDKALKFNVSPKTVLFHDYPDDVEQAISVRNNKKPLTTEKREAISSSGTGITSSKETLDVKKMSMKDLLKSVSRK